MKSFAGQGGPGSFHEIAGVHYFGPETERVYCEQFKDVITAVSEGDADNGILAIENSTFGGIIAVHDLLNEYVGVDLDMILDETGELKDFPDSNNLWVCGEISLQVNHQLIGLPGARLDQVTSVHSQPPALEQCNQWLRQELHHAEKVEEEDTAGSVLLVKDWGDPTKAAIASAAVAEHYGMAILASDIQRPKTNETRFLVLERHPEDYNGEANKTYLSVKVAHRPGSLADVLQGFAGREINLTDLEKRPVPGEPGKKMFYIEAEAGLHEKRMREALNGLRRNHHGVRVLGNAVICQAVYDSNDFHLDPPFEDERRDDTVAA